MATFESGVNSVMPRRVRSAGPISFGPVVIPVGLSIVTVRMARNSWADTGGIVAEMGIDLSLDSGKSWILDHVRVGAVGGDLIDRKGNPITHTTATIGLPEPNNPNRKIRGRGILNASLDCSMDVEVK